MNVRELMAKLATMNPESPIYTTVDRACCGYEDCGCGTAPIIYDRAYEVTEQEERTGRNTSMGVVVIR